jgi:hypothetical protein
MHFISFAFKKFVKRIFFSSSVSYDEILRLQKNAKKKIFFLTIYLFLNTFKFAVLARYFSTANTKMKT